MTLSIRPVTASNHHGLTVRPATPARSNALQDLRFSGDALTISRQKKQKAAAEAEKAEAKERQKEEADFKAIGDQIIGRDNQDTLNVAEMIAYLCRIRKADNYPGYGAPETLAEDFPGMNMDVNALKKAFNRLYQKDYLDTYQGEYWLRPPGLELLKKVYPKITLPPKKDLFTQSLKPINGIRFDITPPQDKDLFTAGETGKPETQDEDLFGRHRRIPLYF